MERLPHDVFRDQPALVGDRVVGEAVLNDLDTDNASANYRISLAGPDVFGRGYGTDATRANMGSA